MLKNFNPEDWEMRKDVDQWMMIKDIYYYNWRTHERIGLKAFDENVKEYYENARKNKKNNE